MDDATHSWAQTNEILGVLPDALLRLWIDLGLESTADVGLSEVRLSARESP